MASRITLIRSASLAICLGISGFALDDAESMSLNSKVTQVIVNSLVKSTPYGAATKENCVVLDYTEKGDFSDDTNWLEIASLKH